jgi:hypothetical protein
MSVEEEEPIMRLVLRNIRAGLVIGFVVLFGYFGSALLGTTYLENEVLSVRLEVKKGPYACGELVPLTVIVKNTGSVAVEILEDTDISVGNVFVHVAYEDGPYREYVGPGWGLRCFAPGSTVGLQPNKSMRITATLLYNHGPDTHHLSAAAAESVLRDRLKPGYALAAPGRYKIKASVYDTVRGIEIGSEPLTIDVYEPEGVDGEVWDILKSNADYAYFIQTGSSPKGLTEGEYTLTLVETLSHVVNDYPRSVYTPTIKSSLAVWEEHSR